MADKAPSKGIFTLDGARYRAQAGQPMPKGAVFEADAPEEPEEKSAKSAPENKAQKSAPSNKSAE